MSITTLILLLLLLLLSLYLEEMLVFHRAPPRVADRGMLPRYGGYRGKKYAGRIKTSAAALLFDTGVSIARGRKPRPNITCSSRLGIDAAGQPPTHHKRKLQKRPF
jgi:hypothetical protein